MSGAYRLHRPALCSCGAPVADRAGYRRQHERGRAHRHAGELRRLLDTDRIPLTTIAWRFGVTRQAVRQWAARLGYPPGLGRARQRRAGRARGG